MLPKSAFLNLCLGANPRVTWGEFVGNLPVKGEVTDTASLTIPGHIKKETDVRSIARSTAHSDLHSRAVLSWQLPLVEVMVGGVSTEMSTVDGTATAGRGLSVTAIHNTPSAGYERLNFRLENTMVLSNVDGSITATETPALSGNYVISCPTAWAHKLKLTAGGTADYLGNKLMNSLYVSGDTLGVQFIDSTSINLSVGGTGLTADVILDGATLQIGASGLSLTSPATYLRTTGDFAVAGLLTLTQLPVCAAVPAANTELVNKLYVDTLDAANVKLTGNQTVAGIKAFTSFPTTPAAAPTTDYQVANKKYVDDHVASDTGWIDLNGFTWLTSARPPQYRVMNGVIYFRGLLVVPLDDPGAPGSLLNYTNETVYANAVGVAPYTAGAGGVVCAGSGGSTEERLTFNLGADVMASAAHHPDQSYSVGMIGIRRVVTASDATHFITYTCYVSLEITAAGLLIIRTVRETEYPDAIVGAVDFPGNAQWRLLNSRATAGDNTINFASVTGGTLQGVTGGGALTYVFANNTETHSITIDASNADEIGGFAFNLDNLRAFTA